MPICLKNSRKYKTDVRRKDDGALLYSQRFNTAKKARECRELTLGRIYKTGRQNQITVTYGRA